MLIDGLLTVILLLAAGNIMLPGLLQFMRRHRMIEVNYMGQSIPTACGLFLLLMLLFGYLLYRMTGWTTFPANPDFVLAAVLVGFAGLLDDLVGDKQTKGIANHWKAWRMRGVPSTAIIKAAAAAASGFILFAGEHVSPAELLLHILLLLLTTNAVNLMDVRPGRALKFYFLMIITMLVIAGSGISQALLQNIGYAWGCLLPIAAGAVILTYPDLKGRIMLGDTGANLLGFSLGCGWVWYTPVSVQVLLILMLLGLHGLTWKRSLTRIIENNRWLSFIDSFGRGRI